MFLLSLDFDPASKPELYPQSISLLRHAFRKNLRVIGMTFWVSGTGMADQVVTQVAREMGKESGKDYVFFGWSPGGTAVIITMGQDLYGAFPADYNGKPTKGLPVLHGVATLRDVNYVVSLAAGTPGVESLVCVRQGQISIRIRRRLHGCHCAGSLSVASERTDQWSDRRVTGGRGI